MRTTMADETSSSSQMSTFHLARDRQQSLHHVVESLNARITLFEQNLNSAIHAETRYHNNIQKLLQSLDDFVAKHVEEDKHLTKLIEEDTQRSREAREDYDVLASRFDDTLKRDSPKKRREWLRNVYVYLSIVVSVVLMAPLHAFWCLITNTCTRLGIRSSPKQTNVYSTSRYRQRYDSPKLPKSTPRVSSARQRSRNSGASNAVREDHKRAPQSPSSSRHHKATPSEAAGTITGTDELRDTQRQEQNSTAIHSKSTATRKKDSENEENTQSGTTTSTSHAEEFETPFHSELDEEFCDARDGINEEEQFVTREVSEAEGVDNEGEDEKGWKRPGWAQPAGSDDTLPEFGKFPSVDFWKISDEDVRLDNQKSDD